MYLQLAHSRNPAMTVSRKRTGPGGDSNGSPPKLPRTTLNDDGTRKVPQGLLTTLQSNSGPVSGNRQDAAQNPGPEERSVPRRRESDSSTQRHPDASTSNTSIPKDLPITTTAHEPPPDPDRPGVANPASKPFKLRLHARARPTPVRNNQVILRVPAGNEKSHSTTREKLLFAARIKYRYTKIRPDQVRLLVIRPGSGDEEINVTLLTVGDIHLGTEDYPYEALSYHWGEGDETHAIIVQEDVNSNPVKQMSEAVLSVMRGGAGTKRLSVRPNLYEALKHLRDPDDNVPLWVDALCINQLDEVEKKTQVMKMSKIYRRAGSVCVWLGLGDKVSYTAMMFITDVINQEKLGDLLSDPRHIDKWVSLFELLKWSWFSRRWVIQELALAKEATVRCGREEVHWDDFRDAIGIFHRYFDILKPKMKTPEQIRKPIGELEPLGAKLLVDLSANLFRRKPNGDLESTMDLETLVSSLAGFDTSDPRDTIHALRNIAYKRSLSKAALQTPGIEEAPEPDYSKDLFEVYRDFVQWVVKVSRSLDIVCRHWALPERAEKGLTTPRLVKLPSWIQMVDESSFGRGEEVFKGRKAGDSFVGLPGKNCYNASAGKEPEVQFGQDDTRTGLLNGQIRQDALAENGRQTVEEIGHDMTLSAKGLFIGVVNWSSDPIPDGVIPQRCLEKIGWGRRDSAEIYKAPDQLWRTLVADRGPNGSEVPTWYHRACLYCLLNRTPNGHINTKDVLEQNDFGDQRSTVQDYLERVRVVTWNRAFLEASPPKDGTTVPDRSVHPLVGLGPPKTEQGDVIAILYGCSVPVVLRPSQVLEEASEPRLYEFIGEAYIYGKMNGEAVDDNPIVEKTFRLQ